MALDMSYVGKLSRNLIHQAVIGDWLIINGLRASNPDLVDIMEAGFPEKTAKYLVKEYSYDDAIISALEATHRNEESAISIFANDDSKEKFATILPIKTAEFRKILELFALQCPVELVCELAPIWAENRRVVSRIRKEYRDQINEITLNHFHKKRDKYPHFNFNDDELVELCNQEVKGRVRLPKLVEFQNIDVATRQANKDGLKGLDKYLYIANEACVFINQVCYREKMLEE